MCTHSMLTAMKLPDRTTPCGKRLISDVRLISDWGDKHDYPRVNTPKLEDAATHVWKLKRGYPDVPAKGEKLDFGASFKRLSVRPGACVILAAEFEGERAESPDEIIMMRPALPFGWSAIRWVSERLVILLPRGAAPSRLTGRVGMGTMASISSFSWALPSWWALISDTG